MDEGQLEVMRLVHEAEGAAVQTAGARGDDGVLTVTFACASATVMLAISRTAPGPDGLLRIDGEAAVVTPALGL